MDPASDTRAPRRRPRRGLRLLSAALLIGVAALWWLLTEPVESRVIWDIDPAHNHGLELADLPGLAVLAGAGRLGVRGAREAWRSGRRG